MYIHTIKKLERVFCCLILFDFIFEIYRRLLNFFFKIHQFFLYQVELFFLYQKHVLVKSSPLNIESKSHIRNLSCTCFDIYHALNRRNFRAEKFSHIFAENLNLRVTA